MNMAVVLAQIASEQTIQEQGILDLLLKSDPVVKLTLLILIACSVVCWAIIFYKYRQVKKAQADAQGFWNAFAHAANLGDMANHRANRSGPLFEIYNTSLELLPRLKKSGRNIRSSREYVIQKLTETREEEIYKLEQYTPFLATTASTAPFIGLFGTVWGILTAFFAIGKAGSSNLATVGPYISEALIATAVGLAAAIPAVVAYNYFIHKTKTLIKMMDLFVSDLVLKLEEDSAP